MVQFAERCNRCVVSWFLTTELEKGWTVTSADPEGDIRIFTDLVARKSKHNESLILVLVI